ncbi:hypothetical protein BDN71DRAFT_1439995 [Pleurotus eryngii]|uniref:Cytochrome b561 domain-containing protein n=1 Tax=Pleurotus eryngii TaxID=5323 RepID=A0A9P6DBL2_PLEER|nr:hypothetical protein BDN71DRAFT_1439995 [Pleurotus eryngii]
MSSFNFPLNALEKTVITHAILCTTGFLILLPLGALGVRYVRTFTNKWFWVHTAWQFIVAGPIIFAGWAYGHRSYDMLGGSATILSDDPHKQVGIALLVLYIIQILLGFVIHFYKPSWSKGARPPQNYLHAILGLVILALAAYQVHYGLNTEWLLTGGLHQVPMSAKNAWLALVIIFWALYGLGMALLPRQYKQEGEARLSSRKLEGEEGVAPQESPHKS